MSRETGLEEILKELRKYLEFQKNLGLETLIMRKKREDKDKTRAEQEENPLTDQGKNIIKVQEQLSIFDTTRKPTLEEIREEIGDCTRCKLHRWRTNIVFGEGNPNARIVFVGEGPGEEEDKQGRPFVGKAGQLLNKILNAMGLKRSDVYICNVVKCRPPGNRTPEPDEIGTCEQFLFKQIKAIESDIIVCLGNVAAQTILRTKDKLGNLRGRFHYYGKAKVMATYHPAALLRNPNLKKLLWEDMQLVIKELNLSVPEKK